MAERIFTTGTDTLMGTEENDIFIASPDIVSEDDAYNTLESWDYANGGEGTDTLYTTIIGEDDPVTDSVIAPKTQDIENVELDFMTGVGNDMTVDFDRMEGVENVTIHNMPYADSNPTSAIVHIDNVRDISNFTFSGTQGEMDITGSVAETLNLNFRNAGEYNGEMKDSNTYRVDIGSTNKAYDPAFATQANINLVSSNVNLDVMGDTSTLNSVNITNQGASQLALNSDMYQDGTITDVTIEGSGVLDLEIGMGEDAVLETFDSTVFTGDLALKVEDLKAAAQITTGNGANNILIIGENDTVDIGAATSITTGAGEDHIDIHSGEDIVQIADGVSIDSGAGDDEIYLYGNDEIIIGDNFSITAGGGYDEVYLYTSDDDITIGDNFAIDTGSGEDNFTINTSYDLTIGDNLSITTGYGEDRINIEGDYNFTLGKDATIDTGAGDDFLKLRARISDMSIGNDLSIATGDGDDEVDIYAESYMTIGTDLSIATGDGDDEVDIYAESYMTIGTDLSIATGDGNDEVTLTAEVEDMTIGDNFSIATGDGDDEVNLYAEEDMHLGANTTIDTGAGEDFVHIKTEYGELTIDENFNIDTGSKADEVKIDAMDDVLMIGANSSISTGYGNDQVKLYGDTVDLGDNVAIKTGDGDDYINTDDLVFGANASIDTGKHSDDVNTGSLEGPGLISTSFGWDHVTVDGTISADMIIDGGDGTDHIDLNNDTIHTISDGQVINFEALTINDTSYHGDEGEMFDMNIAFGDINDVSFADGLGEDTTLTGLETGASVTFEEGGDGDVTIELADTPADVLNVNLEGSSGPFNDGPYNVTANNIETINVNVNASSDKFSDSDQTINLSADSVTTVNVTGNDSVEFGETLSTVREFDASTSTGDIDVDLSGLSHTREVTTGTGDDTVVTGSKADVVTTGDGDDTVTTGYGVDTVNTGNGDDTIKTEGGGDTIWAGQGADTVEGGSGADQIGLGGDDDTDTLVYTDQTDSTDAERDNVTGFNAEDDMIDLTAVKVNEVTYLGEFDSHAAFLEALSGGGSTESGLNSNTSVLLVDLNGDGNMTADDDMVVELDGVTDLEQDNFVEDATDA